MAIRLEIVAVIASGYTTSRTNRSRSCRYQRHKASTHRMPRLWPTARYVTYSLTKDGGTPTLLFEMFADSSARLKSTSRRKITGQAIDTIIAHVTSGHCHLRGSDQRSAPGPES